MKHPLYLIIALAGLFLAGCAGTPEPAAPGMPFDIATYFDRTIHGHGVIERGGQITSRFDMLVDGELVGNQLTLKETFLFREQDDFVRTWRLERSAPGTWVGSADNVHGETTIRVENGMARMRYTADFPNDDKMLTLHFDQQLYPMQDDLVMNRSTLSKFFIPVGTVTVIFSPDEVR